MASDTSSNANANPAQADMDDILSSIRSGVAEEGSKVGTGSADLIEAADADNGAEDDVLELSETDMVAVTEPDLGGAAGAGEELIDLDAFGTSGEAKTLAGEANVADGLLTAEPAAAAATGMGDAADEFDRLLAEISQEQQQQVVASKISKEELLAEEVPLGTEEPVAVEEPAEAVAEESAGELVAEAAGDVDVTEEAAMAMTESVVQATVGRARFELGAVQGPDGVQIAFPAEVLAMALRPMVQEWLSKNLPDVVEKLVKEEISKLAQN